MKINTTTQAVIEPERSITIAMDVSEAATILFALRAHRDSHVSRKRGGWGHFDVIPDYETTISDIQKAITDQQPKISELLRLGIT